MMPTREPHSMAEVGCVNPTKRLTAPRGGSAGRSFTGKRRRCSHAATLSCAGRTVRPRGKGIGERTRAEQHLGDFSTRIRDPCRSSWVGSCIGLYQHGKWDLNGARVWAIARLLEIDHPESVQGEVLVDLLKRHGISADQALDAWGRPLMVEVQHGPDDEYHYLVRSYGRDGRPGPCSVARDCHSLDADWVIRDGEFRVH